MNPTPPVILSEEEADELRSSAFTMRLKELGEKIGQDKATEMEKKEFAEMTSFIDEMPLDRLEG